MTDSQIETEATYRISDLSRVRTLLNTYEVAGSKTQTDTYLSPPGADFSGDRVNYLRVRKDASGEAHSFDFHIVHNDAETEEFETRIEDPDQLLGILETLGFEPYVRVKKSRTIFDADGFEVTLDLINEIGGFIEIESVADDVDHDELDRIATALGLTEEDKVTGKGYPDLIVEARNDAG